MAKKKEYKKSFFIDMNMQNPPKPHIRDWFVRIADKTSYPEYTVCGYEFTLDCKEDSIGIAEGSDPNLNFRRAFLPEKGHYWVSRDFAGQELRIMANLAQETTWINAFLNDEDVHKATAIILWGEENYNRDYRKKAKAINFGMIYGKGAASLAVELGIAEEEAQQYINKYFEKLPNVARFLKRCEIKATQDKEIQNLYGRKRRMKSYINEWGKLMGIGKRKAYNTPIQSMGAEITKLALIKVYNGLLINNKYKNNIFFLNTIHDEINVSVAYNIVEEAADLMGKLMLHKMPNGPVPIISELEIGHNMGLTWKFNQDPTTLKLTPVYESLEAVA